MKIIDKLWRFPWADILAGGRLLLSLLGVVWLIGLFMQQMPWWIVLPEAFFVGVALVVCWLLATWWRERKRERVLEHVRIGIDEKIARMRARRRADGLPLRRQGDPEKTTESSLTYPQVTPLMRKRFVYFDGQTGDPIYHMEEPGTL